MNLFSLLFSVFSLVSSIFHKCVTKSSRKPTTTLQFTSSQCRRMGYKTIKSRKERLNNIESTIAKLDGGDKRVIDEPVCIGVKGCYYGLTRLEYMWKNQTVPGRRRKKTINEEKTSMPNREGASPNIRDENPTFDEVGPRKHPSIEQFKRD